MFGIPFPPAGELVGRFEEAVEIIDRLMREEEVSFEGRYYTLANAEFRPGPVQKPRPPLTIGAHGPRMLKLCAKYADAWNSFGSVEEVRERNRVLDEKCVEVKRDPKSIVRSLYFWVAKAGLDPWESVDAFQEMVGRYREAGINEFIVDQPRADQSAVLERVAMEVIPAFRA